MTTENAVSEISVTNLGKTHKAYIAISIISVLLLWALLISARYYFEELKNLNNYYLLYGFWSFAIIAAFVHIMDFCSKDHGLTKKHLISNVSIAACGLCFVACILSVVGPQEVTSAAPEFADHTLVNTVLFYLFISSLVLTLTHLITWFYDINHIVINDCIVIINGIAFYPGQNVKLFPWKKYDIKSISTSNVINLEKATLWPQNGTTILDMRMATAISADNKPGPFPANFDKKLTNWFLEYYTIKARDGATSLKDVLVPKPQKIDIEGVIIDWDGYALVTVFQ